MPCVALAAGALIAIPLAVNAQSFRCVGKDGKKYYGQTIPNQCIGQPVEELDKQGVVVRRIENQVARGQGDQEGRGKEEVRGGGGQEGRGSAQPGAARDLLEREGHRRGARARARGQPAGDHGHHRRLEEIKKRQAQLAGEMEFYKKNPAPLKLQNDVKSAQVDFDSQANLLEVKKKEIEAINARYDEDKKRFAALTKKSLPK
jgi:hypothetical protein